MAIPLLGMLGRGLVGRGGTNAAGGVVGRSSITRTAASNIPRPTGMVRRRTPSLGMLSGFSSALEPGGQEQSAGQSSSLSDKLKLNFTDFLNLGTNAKSQIVVNARTFNITGDIKDSIVNVVNPKNMIVKTASMMTGVSGDGGSIKSQDREKELERRRGLKRFMPQRVGAVASTAKQATGGLIKTLFQIGLFAILAQALAPLVWNFLSGYLATKYEENKERIGKFLKRIYDAAVDGIAFMAKDFITSKVELVKNLIELVKVHVLAPIDNFFGMKVLQETVAAIGGLLTAAEAGTVAVIDMIATKAKDPVQTMIDVAVGTANTIGDLKTGAAEVAVGALTSDVGQAVLKSAPKVAEMPNTVWGGLLDLLKATADVPGQIAEQLGFGGSPDVEPAQARTPSTTTNTNGGQPIIINTQQTTPPSSNNSSGGGVGNVRTNEQNELRNSALGSQSRTGMVAGPAI